MNCRECPYVRDREKISVPDANNRDSLRIPGAIEEHISKEYLCERVDGMPCLNGRCDDAYQKKPEIGRHSGKKGLSIGKRDRKYRMHLRKKAALGERDPLKNPMYGGALYMDETACGPIKKPCYRRYWRGRHNNRFKYWRGTANRKMRRYKVDVHNGGFYKKRYLVTDR